MSPWPTVSDPGESLRTLEARRRAPTVLTALALTNLFAYAMRNELFAVYPDLRARFGTTVLLTTHEMEEADTLCERVGILHGGRLVASGTPAELKAAIGPEATMDDVFVRNAKGTIGEGGSFRDVARTRRTTERLG